MPRDYCSKVKATAWYLDGVLVVAYDGQARLSIASMGWMVGVDMTLPTLVGEDLHTFRLTAHNSNGNIDSSIYLLCTMS